MKEESLNKIYVITTEGCTACKILNKLVEEALTITSKNVEHITEDISQVSKDFLKKHNVRDFPTTFLMKDDIVKYKFTGSWPSPVIARWIDVKL